VTEPAPRNSDQPDFDPAVHSRHLGSCGHSKAIRAGEPITLRRVYGDTNTHFPVAENVSAIPDEARRRDAAKPLSRACSAKE